eukprot:TRINITY_DN1557_c0_g1_i7.p1 TRINITY_DN1557_c0_g1~~TRINITY_DN1557_c0_g1_i7.p1  ORF type:complete len:360 (+),score=67.38 TRINITY_DN1557_c0_g1_i7:107-1081(+)
MDKCYTEYKRKSVDKSIMTHFRPSSMGFRTSVTSLKMDRKKLRSWIESGVAKSAKAQVRIRTQLIQKVWCQSRNIMSIKENHDLNSETGFYYKDLIQKNKTKKLKAERDINKDIHRTFPEHPIYRSPEAKEKLKRVLCAFARRNKFIGYCQSMNFLAGFLLLFVEEEEDAFWLLVQIVEDIGSGFYAKNMMGIQISQRILEEMVKEKLPDIEIHAKNLGVSMPLLVTKWFMCLYIDSLPAETVMTIWDYLFLEGQVVLFQVALAILDLCREHLLKTETATDFFDRLDFHSKRMFNAQKLMKKRTFIRNFIGISIRKKESSKKGS